MRQLGRNLTQMGMLLGLLSLIVGCMPSFLEPTATPDPTPTPTLPPADEVAFAFLQAWERADYAAMYSLLSPGAQAATSEEQFVQTYRQVVDEAIIVGVKPRILAAFQPDFQAEVSFEVTFQTGFVGDFKVQNQMPLVFDQGRWGVAWSPALILPQLSSETFVRLTTRSPSRGNIYDRNGLGLAVQGTLVEVGVIPGKIENEPEVLSLLSAVLGDSPGELQALYAEARPDWYVPLGTVRAETGQLYYESLTSTPGIQLREAWTRSYHPDLIAPHMVGLVGPIQEENVDLWRAQGYTGDESVGQMGLERWGEQFLVGERGGRLEILSYKGELVAILADKPSQESSSLYTTFDRAFQKKVQEILGQRLGAIAVLEAQTGRVLALATYPVFDPNLFPTGISAQQWANLAADGRRPLVNRATQGTYPAGSVFKVVTMSAGMEAGGLTASSSFICRGTWTGLGAEWPKVCWARNGHGRIALNYALTVSCDITFYQVGLMLNGVGQNVLPDYARQFGYGRLTGIEIEESPGLVPDPAWKIANKGEGWAPGDSVNLSIGQGELQVTPLQVAVMMAAVGNGGTLYRPQVIEMIAADPQNPQWVFEPTEVGMLPVSDENLDVIRDSLHKVTASSAGTAYNAFKGFGLTAAGKTGTAESGQEEPHAWFAGYVPAEDPEIAIAVIVEHAGEGGVEAAPLFRQVAEAYFQIGVTPTATLTTTATLTPTVAPTVQP